MSRRFRHLELHATEDASTEEARARAVPASGTPRRTAAEDMRLALDARQHGRFEPALQLYTRALRENRGLIPAWVGQVQMLIELGEHAEARLWSDKALELFRDNGELLAAGARACARQRDHRAAIAASDASLASPGSSPARWQARGEVLLARGAGLVRECFERSLTEPAADWFDRVIIARIYLYHRKAAAAIEHAQAATRLRPDHERVWYVLGQVQEAMGWFDMAETSYERCRELAPADHEATSALDALRGRGMGERIRDWFARRLRR